MAVRSRKPPATQRSFASPWSELDYLCAKIRYWLYARHDRSAAARYLPRLGRVLIKIGDDDAAILAAEAKALQAELLGRVEEAIGHRKREIKLMEQLLLESTSPRYSASTRAYMLRDRGVAELHERLAILANLQATKIMPRTASA